jgi:DNA invertase Pin-like site-specific DNA recombinase
MVRKITKIETPAKLQLQKRVAAYARVSSGKAEMLHSLAAQVSFYSNFIQNKAEWEYVGVYADEAVTGTKDTRPEFQRLLADCRKGLIDEIITKSISRFARNTVTLLETVRELKSLGVGVYFEEQRIHTLSGDGELMLSILASYAQEESRSVSENCKWRIQKDFKEGKPSNNMHVYGYDYKDGKLTIIPEEAETVKMIFADYLSGLGKNAIMKKIVALDIPTKCGGRWFASTIDSILTNEKFIGDMCLQKVYVPDHISKRRKRNKGELPKYYVEATHEAIIDKETFASVQLEMARRAAKANSLKKQIFSEFVGIIHCERCGGKFIKKTNAIGTKYARDVWSCSTYTYRGKHKCSAKRIREDILKEKCAEVLGLTEYDAAIFQKTIAAISVPTDGVLVFNFKNGTRRTVTWENRSRRESWTDEMKQTAREQALKSGGKNG